MREKLYSLASNLSWEEAVIREYWRLLTMNNNCDDTAGRENANRLERLARVALKLESRRQRIADEICRDSENLSQRYGKILKNLAIPMFSELDNLKAGMLSLREQVEKRNLQTERLIAESLDILLKTPQLKKRNLLDIQNEAQRELTC
ncbi:MAG TPA: hypothetical protein DCZ43_07520 [candidate division Zixibacteria bacterium]|jgi:hypothetical protein|nr:hypothetical protein [candidate division Zixibacteria bacterium]